VLNTAVRRVYFTERRAPVLVMRRESEKEAGRTHDGQMELLD
jgi:hypothetical protein